MKLDWNRDRCVGHGQCVAAAPDLWELDDDGYAVLKVTGDVPDALVDRARASERACPECAITVVD
jgi:ferredoxin